jgi:hypothetical protein
VSAVKGCGHLHPKGGSRTGAQERSGRLGNSSCDVSLERSLQNLFKSTRPLLFWTATVVTPLEIQTWEQMCVFKVCSQGWGYSSVLPTIHEVLGSTYSTTIQQSEFALSDTCFLFLCAMIKRPKWRRQLKKCGISKIFHLLSSKALCEMQADDLH